RRPRQGVGRVKKTLASLAGLTVLGGFVVWAGWAAAQQPGSPIQQTKATSNTNTATPASPQRPGTVVGVVNMNSVLKNYLRGKEQGDIAVQIFKEIEGVIQAVAGAHGFDLVLSYPDSASSDPTEMYSQDNVVRKMASQAAIPIYYKPHIDLTDAVVKTLNMRF